MKKFTDFIIKYRSTCGSIGLLIILYISTPNAESVSLGFLFILAGMFFRAWSAGYINKNDRLAKDGPYSLTRNPLYFGNFLMGLGFAISGNCLFCYLIFFVYFLIFFPFLMIFEHRYLKEKFGKEYIDWYKNSNSFFPKIKKLKKGNFNISLYIKNKEYRVIFFSLLVVVIFILKVLKDYKKV
jgi:protein-S-isoprenylcysteine O-methyltransferase Ste14